MRAIFYLDDNGSPWVTDGVNSIKLDYVIGVDVEKDMENLPCWALKIKISQLTSGFPSHNGFKK